MENLFANYWSHDKNWNFLYEFIIQGKGGGWFNNNVGQEHPKYCRQLTLWLYNPCLEVLTVYDYELGPFGPRHSLYSYYQYRASDIVAVDTTFNFRAETILMNFLFIYKQTFSAIVYVKLLDLCVLIYYMYTGMN